MKPNQLTSQARPIISAKPIPSDGIGIFKFGWMTS
jgi:hypothetical protein